MFSIHGKEHKFTSAQDIQGVIDELESKFDGSSPEKTLKKLDFSGNTIGVEASESLAKTLTKIGAHVEEVNFSDIFVSRLKTEIPLCLEHLFGALTHMPKLSVLNLSDNAFGLHTIEPIEDYLPKAISVEHLYLSNNGMGPFAGQRIGKALFKLGENKKKANAKPLLTFECGRNRLENGSIHYLSVGLRAHRDLQVLKLYQNGIRPLGFKNLFTNCLPALTKLQVLDVQDNTVTFRAALYLSKILHLWTSTLVELNLNDCFLEDTGLFHMFHAMLHGKEWTKLEVLKLQFNELTTRSLQILPKLMKEKLSKLQHLELNGNIFSEDAEFLEEVAKVFESNDVENGLDELDELEDLDSDAEEEEDFDYESKDKEDEDVVFSDKEEEFDHVAAENELLKENAEVDDLTKGLKKVEL